MLGFVIDDGASWPSDRIDKDQRGVGALQRFKLKLKQKMVRFWSGKSELQAHFAVSLACSVNVNPRRGWIRAPEAADADVAQSISVLAETVARLEQRFKSGLQATPEGDLGAKAMIDLISKRIWMVGNKKTTGKEVFVALCDELGEAYYSSAYLARRLHADEHHLTNFLNRLALLGVLEQGRNSSYGLSDVGKQMYRSLVVAHDLDI